MKNTSNTPTLNHPETDSRYEDFLCEIESRASEALDTYLERCNLPVIVKDTIAALYWLREYFNTPPEKAKSELWEREVKGAVSDLSKFTPELWELINKTPDTMTKDERKEKGLFFSDDFYR